MAGGAEPGVEPVGSTAGPVVGPVARAAVVTTVGLVLVLASIPFPAVRSHGELREAAEFFGVAADRFTRDDVLLGFFVAGVALAVVVALLARRAVLLAWVALPAAVAAGWMVLVACDIQFDTSFLASEVQVRVNRDRSLAPAGWVGVVGMLVVVVGLTVPVWERWTVRRPGR